MLDLWNRTFCPAISVSEVVMGLGLEPYLVFLTLVAPVYPTVF
jgi:hypothetical protein